MVTDVVSVIRRVMTTDYDVWLEMVGDYDSDVLGEAEDTWLKLLNSRSGVIGLLILREGVPVGFMNYLFHEHTFMKKPACYLADLYVKPAYRRRGIAREMIEYLIGLAKLLKWPRVYWVTENGNPVRILYDEYGEQDFVRFHVDFK